MFKIEKNGDGRTDDDDRRRPPLKNYSPRWNYSITSGTKMGYPSVCLSIYLFFLDAALHLYKRVCPSVHWSRTFFF